MDNTNARIFHRKFSKISLYYIPSSSLLSKMCYFPPKILDIFLCPYYETPNLIISVSGDMI